MGYTSGTHCMALLLKGIMCKKFSSSINLKKLVFLKGTVA
jgi:hypothetical protein